MSLIKLKRAEGTHALQWFNFSCLTSSQQSAFNTLNKESEGKSEGLKIIAKTHCQFLNHKPLHNCVTHESSWLLLVWLTASDFLLHINHSQVSLGLGVKLLGSTCCCQGGADWLWYLPGYLVIPTLNVKHFHICRCFHWHIVLLIFSEMHFVIF